MVNIETIQNIVNRATIFAAPYGARPNRDLLIAVLVTAAIKHGLNLDHLLECPEEEFLDILIETTLKVSDLPSKPA